MKRIRFLFWFLILCLGAGFSSARLNFFTLEKENNDLIVSWQTTTETDVSHFDLLRRTQFSNNQFVEIASVVAHGIDKPYLYRDDQVYKSASEQVDYRLEVVYTNGVREELGTKSVNYTPTAIRRTWGSIKAMFQ